MATSNSKLVSLNLQTRLELFPHGNAAQRGISSCGMGSCSVIGLFAVTPGIYNKQQVWELVTSDTSVASFATGRIVQRAFDNVMIVPCELRVGTRYCSSRPNIPPEVYSAVRATRQCLAGYYLAGGPRLIVDVAFALRGTTVETWKKETLNRMARIVDAHDHDDIKHQMIRFCEAAQKLELLSKKIDWYLGQSMELKEVPLTDRTRWITNGDMATQAVKLAAINYVVPSAISADEIQERKPKETDSALSPVREEDAPVQRQTRAIVIVSERNTNEFDPARFIDWVVKTFPFADGKHLDEAQRRQLSERVSVQLGLLTKAELTQDEYVSIQTVKKITKSVLATMGFNPAMPEVPRSIELQLNAYRKPGGELSVSDWVTITRTLSPAVTGLDKP